MLVCFHMNLIKSVLVYSAAVKKSEMTPATKEMHLKNVTLSGRTRHTGHTLPDSMYMTRPG